MKLTGFILANSLLECNDKILNINLLDLICKILPTKDDAKLCIEKVE